MGTMSLLLLHQSSNCVANNCAGLSKIVHPYAGQSPCIAVDEMEAKAALERLLKALHALHPDRNYAACMDGTHLGYMDAMVRARVALHYGRYRAACYILDEVLTTEPIGQPRIRNNLIALLTYFLEECVCSDHD